ncbi:MAG: hypothetical protein ACRC55_06705 [Plesiomonas sp.]
MSRSLAVSCAVVSAKSEDKDQRLMGDTHQPLTACCHMIPVCECRWGSGQ